MEPCAHNREVFQVIRSIHTVQGVYERMMLLTPELIRGKFWKETVSDSSGKNVNKATPKHAHILFLELSLTIQKDGKFSMQIAGDGTLILRAGVTIATALQTVLKEQGSLNVCDAGQTSLPRDPLLFIAPNISRAPTTSDTLQTGVCKWC